MIKNFIKKLLGEGSFNSLDYWEKRYAAGGNSGDGSYGRLSLFKARIINDFLKEHKVQTAVEMGCGDGHQLSIIHYPFYTGLDVSATIIEQCREKFVNDPTKKFVVYDPTRFSAGQTTKSELALSLDVLYHIVEKSNYEQYLKDLFSLAEKFVMIYSTDFYEEETQHVLHRKFTEDVNRMFPHWKLMKHIKNDFPGTGEQESMADFFIYQRK